MKTLCLFLVCLITATSSFAQLSITSADYLKTLNVPITKVRHVSSDTSGLMAVLNASGAGMSWNITGRTYNPSETTTEVLLLKSGSGAPSQGTSAFSSANYVVRRQTASEPGFTDWTYLTHSTSALSYNGYASDSAGVLKSLQTNSPAERIRNFPTTYPGSWSWSSTVTSTSYSGGTGVGVGTSMSGNDVVDGYGTVTTPEGTFACLRIKSRSNINLGFFTITSYYYDFIDQNRTIASISAGSTGTVADGVTYYRQQSATAVVQTENSMPGAFELFQNYPNPFNPSTAVQFNIPSESYVTLRLYNALGVEVETLVASILGPGTYSKAWNAAGYPTGVYFCRMQARQRSGGQAGVFVMTKRLLLVR